ncbi:MAG TPA: PaaI family thioesterase [Anaerovoracaceae bacterium]|nr:PaaI family thioesterase [Anaerovoracaceae bacterium]
MTELEFLKRIENEILHRQSIKESINEKVVPSLVSCSLEKKTMEVVYKVTQWTRNSFGVMQGGIIATIFDITMGILCKIYSDAEKTPTITLNVTYARPVEINKDLHIKADIIYLGETIINVTGEAWVEQEDKCTVATAVGTFFRVKS